MIVDVFAHRLVCQIWAEGFQSVIALDHEGGTTNEMRQAARAAGKQALICRGYSPDAIANPQ